MAGCAKNSQFTVRTDQDERDRFAALCARYDVTASWAIRQFMRRSLAENRLDVAFHVTVGQPESAP